MIELFAALEGSVLAGALRRSAWAYPLVNAGHILGLALLVGAVVPMDLRVLARRRDAAVGLLRPYAVAGFLLAAGCGALLFIAQATDYAQSPWFRAKLAIIALALANAALHLRRDPVPRPAAAASLVLWPLALIAGRMIAYG